MKKIILLGVIFCLFLSCATTDNTKQQSEQADYYSDNEPMDIKVVGPPSPMIATPANKRAASLYNMGTRLLKENKLAEAAKCLKEAIDLDPLFVDAMDHLGMVYRRQNRLIEAENIYLRSIEINDKNKVPLQNLAVVYRLQNRMNEALQLYQKMIQLDKDDPEGYYGIGELFFIAGDYKNSMLFFDKAIELYIKINSPYVYDAFYYKGMMYYSMNQNDEALKYLEESLKGNPGNATIKNTINEIKSKKS